MAEGTRLNHVIQTVEGRVVGAVPGGKTAIEYAIEATEAMLEIQGLSDHMTDVQMGRAEFTEEFGYRKVLTDKHQAQMKLDRALMNYLTVSIAD